MSKDNGIVSNEGQEEQVALVEENIYPISREAQVQLWHECATDATRISQDLPRMDVIASNFFKYRVGILSDRVLDHDLFNATDDDLGLQVEDIDE